MLINPVFLLSGASMIKELSLFDIYFFFVSLFVRLELNLIEFKFEYLVFLRWL